MADYKISLGVNVNVAGIQEQINKAKLGPIKVNLDVKNATADIKKIQNQLKGMGFGKSSVGKITKDLENMNLTVSKVTTNLKKNGNLEISVKGIDKLNRAVTLVREYTNKGDLLNGKKLSQSFKTDIDEINEAFNKLKQKQKEISSLELKLTGLSSKEDAAEIKELTSQLKTLKKEYDKLYSGYGDRLSGSQNNELAKGLQNAENKIKQLKSKMKDEIQFKIDTGDFEKDISNIESKLKNINNAPKELKNSITQLKAMRTRMNTALHPKDGDEDIDKAVREYEKYQKLLATTNNQVGIIGRADKDEASQIIDIFNQIKRAKQDIGGLEIELIGAEAKNDAKTIETINKQLDEYKTKLKDLENLRPNAKSARYSSKFTDRQKSELEAIDTDTAYRKEYAASQILDKMATQASNIRNKLKDTGFSGFSQEVVRAHENVEKLNVSSDALQSALTRVDNAFNAVQTADNAGDMKALVEANKEYEESLKRLDSQINLHKQAQQDALDLDNLELDKANALLRLENLFEQGSDAAKKYGKEVQKLKNEINECADSGDMQKINKQIGNLKIDIKNSNLQTETFGSRLKKQFDRYRGYLSIASIFMYAEQGLRDMFQQVLSIDSAMTELKKVTDETDASYNQFLSSAATRSKKLGTTIDGLVSSTADFAKLGYSFEESQGLAEVANIYAVVGDEIEGVEGATQSLVSTLAAFRDEMGEMSDTDFAMSIVDKFNEVANNFSISSGGIGEALTRSASSLAAANNTLDESIALITAANEVTQNPEKVGNAMKTISMRIRGAKTELEEAGESTDGMAESTASLREEMLALSGVDIMLNESTFKSTYQIMDELSQRWQGLSDIAQATIIELVAGKHQGNVFSSLMANFDTARDALKTSIDSSGSAMKEHAKWSESLEARLNKLKSTWQSLSQSFMSSDLLKGGLDILTGFVDIIDTIISKIGTLPTLLGAFGIGKTISNFLSLSGEIKSFKDVFTALGLVFPNAAKGVGVFTKALANGTKGFGLMKAAASGLWTVIAAHPILATVAALGAVIALVDKYTESADELAERIEGVTSNYKEQHSSLMKLKGDYDTSKEDSMISKYGELSKGVNSLGENVSLTADEYAEYQNIVSQIANQNPDLVTGYNSQGDAILSCAGNVDKLAESYKNLIREQNKEVLDTGEDIFKDFKNDLEDTTAYYKTLKTNADGSTDPSETIANYDMKHLDQLEKFMNLSDKELESAIAELSSDEVARISELLDEYGIERNVLGSGDAGWENQREHIIRALGKDKAEIKNILNEAADDLNAYAEDMGTVTEAYFSQAFLGDYANMSDRMQGIITKITSGFDSEFYAQFLDDENPYESLTKYYDSILDTFNNLSSADTAKIETAFDLKTQFNGGDISYGEYVKSLQDVGSLVNDDDLKLAPEIKSQIKLSLGLNEEGLVEEYENLVTRLTGTDKNNVRISDFEMDEDAARKFLDGLSVEELSVATKIIPELSKNGVWETVDELKAAIDREMLVQGLGLDFNIEVETTWIETLNTALEESASVTGLTAESIQSLTNRYKDLEGFDAESLFERTAHGVKINADAVNNLESALEKKNKAELDSYMEELQGEYHRLTEDIKNAGSTAERADLYADRDAIVDQINDVANLISQYEGLTSAYNEWINAQSGKDKGDTHGEVMGSMEAAKELYESGYVGTNEFKASAQFLSYDDLSNADIDTVVDKWVNGKKKFDKYFTEDESGSEKFLNDLNKINESWAKFENGEWSVDIDIEKAAEEMGVSTSFIMAMLDELEARGIKLNYEDEGLEEFKTHAEEAANYLEEITGNKIDLKIGTGDIDTVNSELDRFKLMYDTITTADGKVNLDADGAKECRDIILALIKEKQQLEKPAIMDVEVSAENAETDIGKATQAVQNLQNNLWKLEQSDYDPNINSAEVQTEINKIIGSLNTLEQSDPEIYAKLGLDDTQIANLKTAIGNIQANIKAGVEPSQEDIATVQSTIKGIDATVVANVLTGEVTGTTGEATITPKPSTTDLGDGFTGKGKITVSPDKLDLGTNFTGTGIASMSPNKTDFGNVFTGSGTVNLSYTVSGDGTSPATGTAHTNGSAFSSGTSGRAFARGNWGIKGNGVALGGELGQELVVRDGRFFTIGDTGAEFFHYKQNDIVFNAAQTESLFKYGGIKGAKPRGTMLASGTAFADGSVPSSGRAFPYTAGGKGKIHTNTVTGATYGSSSGSKDKDEFEETIDWIEITIDRIERAIDQLDTKVNSVYRSWSERNKSLENEISKVGDEIELQQKAYDKYIEAANGVGLDEEYASKVRDGTIDIETIKDEELKEKIDDYRQWYEKALDCRDAVEDLKETESELYAQRFENVQSQYEGILQGYEHTEAMLNEYISQAEEQGYIVSKKYYEALINNEKDSIAELKKEQADLIAERDKAVADGKIAEGSEEWYNMCAEIDSVTQAIEESTTALLEYENSMREIDWSVFDLAQERIAAVSEEVDFLIELMSNEKLFDDNGKLTSQGLATMALHGQNYDAYMYQADEYAAEIAKLNAQIAEDPYDQELINRRNELIDLQRESILAAEDEKNAIRDMVEEGINLELDALQERIDKYNESIEAAKDLYDYQKDVQKQSEEIASLEKQRAAYLGNDSDEAKAKLQEIEVSLKEARENLQETEYDKYISDQQALLDTLYNEYELILNQRLDNVDALLEGVIESINLAASADGTIATALGSEGALAIAVNNNATSIKDTLVSEAKNVGTTLSSAMNNIWSVGDGNAKSVLTMYGEDFRTKSSTVITTLNSIKTSVNSMVASLNKEAEKKTNANKTTTSAKKNPTTSSSSSKKKTTTIKKSSSGDGTPKIGDRVKYVSGQYYYDSQGKKPLGSYNKGGYVYITNINKKDWATHGYHISTGNKLGKGDLGWLKLNQLSGYATGKKNFLDDETAWTQENGKEEYIVRPSDGAILTPIARKGSVLNAQASDNLWNMTNSPAEFIKENLKFGTASVPNNSNVQSNYTQYLDKVVFNLPNVKNYEEFLSAMQKDKNFERLIKSMTIDQIAGKSSLAKNKSVR